MVPGRIDSRIAKRIGQGQSLVDASGHRNLCLLQAWDIAMSGGHEDRARVETLRLRCAEALRMVLSSLSKCNTPVQPMLGKATLDQVKAELRLLQSKQGPLTRVTSIALSLLFPGSRIVTYSPVHGDDADSAALADSEDGYEVDNVLLGKESRRITLAFVPFGVGHYKTITKVCPTPKEYRIASVEEVRERIEGWKYILESASTSTLMTCTLAEMLDKQAHVLDMTKEERQAVLSALGIGETWDLTEEEEAPPAASHDSQETPDKVASTGVASKDLAASQETASDLSTSTHNGSPSADATQELNLQRSGDGDNNSSAPSTPGSSGNGLGRPSPASQASEAVAEGDADDGFFTLENGQDLRLADGSPLRASQMSEASADVARRSGRIRTAPKRHE